MKASVILKVGSKPSVNHRVLASAWPPAETKAVDRRCRHKVLEGEPENETVGKISSGFLGFPEKEWLQSYYFY